MNYARSHSHNHIQHRSWLRQRKLFCRDNVSRMHGKNDYYNDKGVHT